MPENDTGSTGGGFDFRALFRGLSEVTDPTGEKLAKRLQHAREQENKLKDIQAAGIRESIVKPLPGESPEDYQARVAAGYGALRKIYSGGKAPKDVLDESEKNHGLFSGIIQRLLGGGPPSTRQQPGATAPQTAAPATTPPVEGLGSDPYPMSMPGPPPGATQAAATRTRPRLNSISGIIAAGSQDPDVVARRAGEQAATAAGLKAGAETAATEPTLQAGRMELQRLIQSGMDGRALLTAMQTGRPTLEQQAMEAAVAKLPPDKQKDPAAVYEALVQLKRDFEKPTAEKEQPLDREQADLESIPPSKRTPEQASRLAAIKRTRTTNQQFVINNRRPVRITTTDASGETVTKFVDPETGDEYAAAPTAEQRNREAARKNMPAGIEAIKTLSQKLISTRGLAQRSQAIRRGIAAFLGNDPEYRAYQGARFALAGNLAVLQQGSRPSDADIRAVQLPLVPDVFSDTDESADLKWKLIYILNSMPQPDADSRKVTATNPKTGEKLESTDGGKTWHPPSQ